MEADLAVLEEVVFLLVSAFLVVFLDEEAPLAALIREACVTPVALAIC